MHKDETVYCATSHLRRLYLTDDLATGVILLAMAIVPSWTQLEQLTACVESILSHPATIPRKLTNDHYINKPTPVLAVFTRRPTEYFEPAPAVGRDTMTNTIRSADSTRLRHNGSFFITSAFAV